MTEGLPPPPSYDSLFTGGPEPPGPGPQPDTNTRAAQAQRSFSRQASAESSFPPSHPFYPGPPSGLLSDPQDPTAHEGPSSQRHHYPGVHQRADGRFPGDFPSMAAETEPRAGPSSAPGAEGFNHVSEDFKLPSSPSEKHLQPSAPSLDRPNDHGFPYDSPGPFGSFTPTGSPPYAPGANAHFPGGQDPESPRGSALSGPDPHPPEHHSRERLHSTSPRVSPRPSISGAVPISKVPSPVDQPYDPLLNPCTPPHDGSIHDMHDPFTQNNAPVPYPLHPNRRPCGDIQPPDPHVSHESYPGPDPFSRTPTGPFGEFGTPADYLPPQGSNIPIVIDDTPEIEIAEDDNVTNPNAPPGCRLVNPEDYDELVLAEGQRDIDQLGPPRSDPALFKWCCVAFWSLGAHIGFCVCIICLVYQIPLKLRFEREWIAWRDAYRNMSRGPEPVKEYDKNTVICASVFLVVCWIVGVIEGCMSDTDSYVGNTMPIAEFRNYVKTMREKVPTIRWIGESYHQAKERVEWVGGRIVSRRRSSDYHKCVSYREVVAFPFSVCLDASGDVGVFKKGVINRFEFEKTFGFADVATAEEYSNKKKCFIDRIKSKDTSYDFREEFDLPDMKERVTVFLEEGCRSTLMKPGFYLCLTCLLLTWPYRIFFRCSTRKKKFTFVKLIQL